MKNKHFAAGIMALVLATILAGGAFAQEKHQSFDTYLGLNFGFGVTPGLFKTIKAFTSGEVPTGNRALIIDFGLTGDFYILNWLSATAGFLMHPDIYAILDQDFKNVDSFTDIAATPLCLTIPLAVHVNIPRVEWLYTGIGLSLNIPLFSLLKKAGVDKGKFFVGLPIDVGFDFIKPERGGVRLFFRVTPEFHEKGTTVPLGFILQIYNWKIYGKSSQRETPPGNSNAEE